MELTYKNLNKLYVKERLSTRGCAKVFNISQAGIMSALKRFNIKTRSYKENIMPTKKGSHLSESHRKAIAESMTNNPRNYMNGRFGKKHPFWKNGKSIYREVALKNMVMICEGCHKGINDVKRLIVHHKNENRLDNRLSNLEILCDSCHRILHNLRDKR